VALRSRLSAATETVQEFFLAADEKYLEGQRLVAGGDARAGIYLMGYAAEMLLKNTCFRFNRATLASDIESRLPPARSRGKVLIPAIRDEFYHSLRFWAMLLQATRADQGRSWVDAEFALEFERCTERLYNNWWVEMRYRRNLARPEEARQVMSDVGWIRAHLTTLWS